MHMWVPDSELEYTVCIYRHAHSVQAGCSGTSDRKNNTFLICGLTKGLQSYFTAVNLAHSALGVM